MHSEQVYLFVVYILIYVSGLDFLASFHSYVERFDAFSVHGSLGDLGGNILQEPSIHSRISPPNNST